MPDTDPSPEPPEPAPAVEIDAWGIAVPASCNCASQPDDVESGHVCIEDPENAW